MTNLLKRFDAKMKTHLELLTVGNLKRLFHSGTLVPGSQNCWKMKQKRKSSIYADKWINKTNIFSCLIVHQCGAIWELTWKGISLLCLALITSVVIQFLHLVFRKHYVFRQVRGYLIDPYQCLITHLSPTDLHLPSKPINFPESLQLDRYGSIMKLSLKVWSWNC